MQSKYVVLKINGVETPFVFPTRIQHSDFVKAFSGDIVSAGFVILYEESGIKFLCNGESVSLSIKSRKKDSELLTRVFCH